MVSLRLTSVANATLLVNYAPLWVTLGGWWLFKDRIKKVFLVGMLSALAGATLIVGGSLQLRLEQVWGDLLALIASIFYAGYLLSIKYLRRDFSTAIIMNWTTAGSMVLLLLGHPGIRRKFFRPFFPGLAGPDRPGLNLPCGRPGPDYFFPGPTARLFFLSNPFAPAGSGRPVCLGSSPGRTGALAGPGRPVGPVGDFPGPKGRRLTRGSYPWFALLATWVQYSAEQSRIGPPWPTPLGIKPPKGRSVLYPNSLPSQSALESNRSQPFL